MSLRAQFLNAWLRRFERPAMERTAEPADLRRRFERQARLFFRAPAGTKTRWLTWDHVGSGVEVLEIRPRAALSQRVLFYIHGGGFVFGSPRTHAAMVAALCQRVGARAVLPRYSLAPEAPFPAARNDVRAAWDALCHADDRPDQIVVGGDSAGGALALSLVAELLAEGAPLPGGVFCLSPLTDMTFSGDSFRGNADAEAVLPVRRADEMTQMYLAGQAPDDPRISPLFARFKGAPPVWITVGDTEILRDDARRMQQLLRDEKVDVTFEEQADLPHVWPIFHNILPEARTTLDSLADWIKALPSLPDES